MVFKKSYIYTVFLIVGMAIYNIYTINNKLNIHYPMFWWEIWSQADMSYEAGYDARLVHKLPNSLVCLLCKKILCQTIQTNRGLRACKKCYELASL